MMPLILYLLSGLLPTAGGLTYDSPYKNEAAFAALRNDGTLLTWGSASHGAGLGTVTGVIAVASTTRAYAAIKQDGTVVCSGGTNYGGTGCPLAVTNLRSLYSSSAPLSTGGAFVARDSADAVYAWGSPDSGGDSGPIDDILIYGVDRIDSYGAGFAALSKDGILLPWSESPIGDRMSNFDDLGRGDTIRTYGHRSAACGLTTGQTVYCWGSSANGADEPGGLTGVKDLYYTDAAFAALKTDGTVVAWGDATNGGTIGAVDATNVVNIFSTKTAFAALKADQTVVAWGAAATGGDMTGIVGGTATNVLNVFSSDMGFVALKYDGSVVGWGMFVTPPGVMDPIIDIVSGSVSFAALSSTGKVYYWGDVAGMSISGPVLGVLTSGEVSAIYAVGRAFAAVYGPASDVACWGYAAEGGDCSALSASLTGVRYIFGNEIRRTSVFTSPTISPTAVPTAVPSTAAPTFTPRRPTAIPTWSMNPTRAPGGFDLFPSVPPSASPSAAPTVSDDPFITGPPNRNMTYYCRPKNYLFAPNGWQRIEPALALLNSSGILNATVWIEPYTSTDELGVMPASKGRSVDPNVGVDAVVERGGAALSFYRAEGYSHPLDWQAVLRNAAYRFSDSLRPCSLYRQKYFRTFYFKVQDHHGRVSNVFAKKLTIETAVVVYTNANSGVIISQDQDLDVGGATGTWGDKALAV